MATAIVKLGMFLRSEDGPSATEYAILLGIITFAALAAMATFGSNMVGIYLAIQSKVSAV